jgi:hypothetical protein
MSILWWAFIILLGLGAVVAAISLVLGIVFFLLVSIIEYIEEKLGIITIGEEEEKLIAQAEKLSEEQRKAFEGPWTLEARVRPYSSKAFQFSRAKEILGKRSTGES